MTTPSTQPAGRPVATLIVMVALLIVGLGLHFWLGPRTPVVATSVETESSP